MATKANALLAGRVGITALFSFTALGHVLKPTDMLEMLPAWVPGRKMVVLLSGLLELALAIGILIPASSHFASLIAITFLVAATPLNVYSAYQKVAFGGHAAGPRYLMVRLPIQVFLIAWIWWFGLRS